MLSNSVDPELYRELAKFGAKDIEICMQCGTCSASCPLSSGTNPFPRKIYRYIQLGLKDKLLKSTEPWLCYYCGDCNKDCPRVLSSTSRIDVVLGNQPGSLKKALQIVNDKGADIINVGMTAEQTGQRVYYFRLAACKTANIKKALQKQGYEVLAALD